MTVSVVVPVRDGAATLVALLDALAGLDPPADEVIVVDNGSRDGSADLARRHRLRPRVLAELLSGSYRARNTGWRASVGTIVAFTDADCVPSPHWLAAGCRAVADADIVGGRVDVIRSRQPSVWERLDAGHYLDQRRNVEQQHFAATANMFIRRDALEQLDGFAELRSGGDRELCARAFARGMTLDYSEDASVEHWPRRSRGQTWRLNRRIGYSLRDLHRLGLHQPWYRDQQMVLSPRWARGTSSDETVRTPAVTAIDVWLTVIAARWVGRVTNR